IRGVPLFLAGRQVVSAGREPGIASASLWLRAVVAETEAGERQRHAPAEFRQLVSPRLGVLDRLGHLPGHPRPSETRPAGGLEVEDTTASTGYPAVTPRPRCSTSSSSPG